ncbi:PREDICTED: GPI ethanolamine phosphate transferase 2 isoform X2 [Acromyrmex echinatior]|uniref:GPI ethanolamine phosphate transferase 2 isoform X2 n=1 Tax=Acromyrmex echinatior TaxID=103372 RepID=UPI000580F1FD|nr:PREDICTED: GPI ethanolamine phosphate transferase 2 isoform X2 [Acromyrmex echinatior]
MERCALRERDYYDFRKVSKDNLLLFYILLIALIFITLFLCGFLFNSTHYEHKSTSNSNIPEYIGNLRIKTDLLYKPLIKRLIFMVIDGLRWDFIAGPIGKTAMPLTSDILTNDHGCLIQAKLQAPTVTMPRIKAMMTGTVPNFVDVILNFGSKPLHTDNLLSQAKTHGYKLIFYGDETWLSLFPNIFDRHDGTTSFFVTDFTEVDNNVTRHIQDELSNDDWDVMILHYLGLDHIGHVEGPFGPSIKPKLQEMDKIVAQIAQKVQNWNGDGEPTLFIVCGDHGIKDSGGHGGSTPEETTVPIITIGGTMCIYEDTELKIPIKVQQLDIAVTLSAALGLPIPSTSLGSVFLDYIYNLQDDKRLFLLNYNSRQLFDHYQKFTNETEYIYQKYLNITDLHLDWLNSNETQRDRNDIENIALSYHAILDAMKEELVTSHLAIYDFSLIVIVLFVMWQMVFIAFHVETTVWTTRKNTVFFFLMGFSLCLGLYLYTFGNITSLCPSIKALLFLLIIGVSYINYNLNLNNKRNVTLKISIYRMLEIITMMHIISFCGSSYIEEEHQTWYFFWSTLIAYFAYKYFTKLLELMHYRNNIVGSTEYYIEHCVMLLLLFLGHIFLRKLNSTGNKWAHLPDIAQWLKEDDSKIGMTLLLLTAFALLIRIAYKSEEEEYKQQSLFQNIAIAVCIYLRHMSNGAVVKIPLYSSSGIYEVQIFWGIIVISLITYGYRVIRKIKHDTYNFMSIMVFFIINMWVRISAMLHQPYNVILLPMQIIVSSIINTVLRENDSLDRGVFLHYWLGNVFYFYQGNSNSLGSVNIAAGYVGLQSYMPFVTAVYLIINTYSAPILAYFLLIYYWQMSEIYLSTILKKIVHTNKCYIAWRLLTTTVYMYFIIFQLNHLFVLSVYLPKLLYEVTYTMTMCCSALLTVIVIAVQHALIRFDDVHRCHICGTGLKNGHAFVQYSDNQA